MKIGITIPSYYEEFLRKIANLNKSNPTKVCSLIVQNFLSYNLKQKKFPKFRKYIKIEFENEKVFERCSDLPSDSGNLCNSSSDSEQLSREAILEQLELIPEDFEDSGLPFSCDSED